jgi:uncharacterized protein YndB with AHSA1/START domain
MCYCNDDDEDGGRDGIAPHISFTQPLPNRPIQRIETTCSRVLHNFRKKRDLTSVQSVTKVLATARRSLQGTRLSGHHNRIPSDGTDVLFTYWINPLLLPKWWPPKAEVDGRLGGAYVMTWPKQNWSLRGTYVKFDPGKTLSFTWAWDHEPDRRPTTVQIDFEPLGRNGSRLTLRHGSYSPEDTEQRKSHLEGWLFFLGRLQAVSN